ncbi:MAG: hypothetical protein QOG75_6833 [Mycobacterium sp.]|nr:hypothetical protein [Mycobacterium sp.]
MNTTLFRQFRYPTVPVCVSSDYRVSTLRRALDSTITNALAFGEERS